MEGVLPLSGSGSVHDHTLTSEFKREMIFFRSHLAIMYVKELLLAPHLQC